MSNPNFSVVYDLSPDQLDLTKLMFWRFSLEKLMCLAAEKQVEATNTVFNGINYIGCKILLDSAKNKKEELELFANYSPEGENYLISNNITLEGANGHSQKLRRIYDVRYRRDGAVISLGENSQFTDSLERCYSDGSIQLIPMDGRILNETETQMAQNMQTDFKEIKNYHLDETKLLMDRAADVLTLGLTNPS